MSAKNLSRLAILIKSEESALLSEWRKQVRQLPSAKPLDIPTLNDHIPALLNELIAALESTTQSIPQALLEGSPPIHGLARWENGFNIAEVVSEYNILRGCVYDLADSHGLSLERTSFHILNRVFDEAIGLAIQTFAAQQALEVQRRRDEYLAFVTHDLRTPLNAISLAARILEIESRSSQEHSKMTRTLQTLQQNLRHLESLVDKVMKESAHIQTGDEIKVELRTFELWPVVESAIQDVAPISATTDTELVNRVPPELSVHADASLLRRILQNLLSNAISYTPRGEVVIAAQEIDAEGSVECSVTDNGAGIPSDRLETIFSKLETDPGKEGGTGLGLAIVKAFVEQQGGTVTVETEEGVGSIFRFTLPGKVPASSQPSPNLPS
ncbi:MAG TPA: HAMP domain-containing sensor histidine kinase [Terrimicrobiaceae bacterium]